MKTSGDPILFFDFIDFIISKGIALHIFTLTIYK